MRTVIAVGAVLLGIALNQRDSRGEDLIYNFGRHGG